MRIIRPYGNSQVDISAGEHRRDLIRNTIGREREDIEDFALNHDELVIAQWISAIDKIASKPSGTGGATKRQRAFRERLGKAALELIKREGKLPGLSGAHSDYLHELWAFKIHPYGKRDWRPRRKNEMEQKPEGRWFEKFANASSPEEADTDLIADRIFEFLYEDDTVVTVGSRKNTKGRIERRALSIAGNTLERKRVALEHFDPSQQSGDDEALELAWTVEDEEAYAKAGNADVAFEIHAEAVARETGEGGKRPSRVTVNVAGKALFEHWPRVFRRDGEVLSMRAADDDPEFTGLVALHNAIRETYASILKRHGKDKPEHKKGRAGTTQRRVSSILPKTMEELYRLMGHQRQNRSLSELVRFGRVLYYSDYFDGSASDAALGNSWYRTTKGQSKIKRTEAFVRTWRNAIVLASRTLKDWADPEFVLEALSTEDNRDDILMNWRSIGDNVEVSEEAMQRKLELLFGTRVERLPKTHADRLGCLRQSIRDLADLRNRVYHFKGSDSFVAGLIELGSTVLDDKNDAVNYLEGRDKAIWEDDCQGQSDVLRATLEGAHVPHFVKEHQAKHLFDILANADDGHLPLPRISRLLTRAKDAWERVKGDKPQLPEPANRVDLEAPARRCQYVLLKLLYERPFRAWLETRESETIAKWIDKAVARSTNAAKSMNSRKGEVGHGIIASRAESLPRPGPNGGIDTFFFDLTAATASEMRVQRGYQSDAESAKKQAGYIEDLKCDVLALAFSDYLRDNKFSWLRDFDVSRPLLDTAPYKLKDFKANAPDLTAEPWQHRLYYLLHLIPVDEVGRLLHQLARWEVASRVDDDMPEGEDKSLKALRRVLVLYLDMHDAKYSGGAALAGCTEFRQLFADDGAFDAVFPAGDTGEDSRVPRRGLREIARFGNLKTLKDLFEASPITFENVQNVAEFETVSSGQKSKIAKLQAEREALHADWTKNKRLGLPSDKVKQYVELIREIADHRQLSNRVNLIEHVRAHKIIMAVVGRLVDYVGLFERDLQFVILALLHDMGERPDNVFKLSGKTSAYEKFCDGRTLEALRDIQAETEAKAKVKAKLLERIAFYFTDVDNTENELRKIRNVLAHLAMFKPGERLDLTDLVNQTRQLMAYDRKLKNAVSQSIRELIEQEGFDLRWQMDTTATPHKLHKASVVVKTATHLGGFKLTDAKKKTGSGWPVKFPIGEALHSAALMGVVARAFNGKPGGYADITTRNLQQIDFAAIDRDIERKQKGGSHNRRKHPAGGKKKPRRPNWNRSKG